MADKEEMGLSSDLSYNDTNKAVGGDIAKSTLDLMQNKTPIVNLYGDGKGFSISDNAKLYEIVKIVKNIVDLNFYNQNVTTMSFQFSIDVKQSAVVFTLNFSDNQVEDNVADFCNGFVQNVDQLLKQKFNNTIEVSSEMKKLIGDADFIQGMTQLVITCKEIVETK